MKIKLQLRLSFSEQASESGKGSQVSCFDWFTLGGWDWVLYWRTVHFGDGMAVLHLHRHQLHLGAFDAVLGGDFSARVLDSGLDTGGHCSGRGSQHLSLSLSLGKEGGGARGRGITQNVHDILADGLILYLLCLHHLSVADILRSWSASLCDKDIIASDTVWRWSRGVRCSKLRVGLCSRSSQTGASHQTQTQQLKHGEHEHHLVSSAGSLLHYSSSVDTHTTKYFTQARHLSVILCIFTIFSI